MKSRVMILVFQMLIMMLNKYAKFHGISVSGSKENLKQDEYQVTRNHLENVGYVSKKCSNLLGKISGPNSQVHNAKCW